MKKFMVNYMSEFFIITFKRNVYSVFKKLCYTAYTFREVFINDVVLLEIIVRIIYYDGNSVAYVVINVIGKIIQSLFTFMCSELSKILPTLTEVYIKVFCLKIF